MLDRVGRPLARRVGVLIEFGPRPALAEQIPQSVELDVDRPEAGALVGRHGCITFQQGMFFLHEGIEVGVELLVVHPG